MYHNPSIASRSGNLIRRIFGGPDAESPGEVAARPSLANHSRRWSDTDGRSRDETIEAIRSFLADFDLELTQASLLTAFAVASGDNLRLRRKFAELAEEGPASPDRLDELLMLAAGDSEREGRLEDMAKQLDVSVLQFTETAREARSAAREHGEVLESELDRFTAQDVTLAEFASWIETAQRIVGVSHNFEARLQRSEREARALRSELAKIRSIADIDPLTELPNRRGFDAVLEDEIKKANENIEPLIIAFCDIDHFKSINDTYGHDTGDRVLRSVARRLAQLTNDKCHAARHGGEEFVMLFRGIPIAEALARIDQTRESLSAKRFVQEATGEVIGNVTFSAGIADVFGYPTPREALRAADQALYRAKQEGRNRALLANT